MKKGKRDSRKVKILKLSWRKGIWSKRDANEMSSVGVKAEKRMAKEAKR